MASGDYLGSILFDGSQSGAQPDGSVGVALEVRTTEAWSSGAHGAKLSIQTTPNLSITQVERIGLNATECVLNDSGANYDFRIESDGNATAFFLDANHSLLGTTGAIGLFTGSPTSGFDVRTSQSINRTTIADADYTVLDTDYLVAYTSISAPHTVNLPTAVGRTGRVVEVKDESGSAGVVNTITIDPSGAETIDGAATLVIATARGRACLYSDGVNWQVLNAII